jgi:hypothetical protein
MQRFLFHDGPLLAFFDYYESGFPDGLRHSVFFTAAERLDLSDPPPKLTNVNFQLLANLWPVSGHARTLPDHVPHRGNAKRPDPGRFAFILSGSARCVQPAASSTFTSQIWNPVAHPDLNPLVPNPCGKADSEASDPEQKSSASLRFRLL